MKLFGTYTGTTDWNPDGNDATKNSSWEAAVRQFGRNVGQTVNAVNVFPCWGSQQYWDGNLGGVVKGIANSGFGTSMVPVVGLKLISYNAAPENYGWNSASAYGDVAAGKWDAMWRGCVKQLAANGFKYAMVRLAYEGNGSFMQDFMTWDAAAQGTWKAAWSHVGSIMKDEAGKQGIRVDMTFNPNVMIGCPDVAGNLPDLASFDVLGLDIYNGYWGSGDVTNADVRRAFWNQPGGWGMLDHIALAKKLGKPVFICECGSGPSANGAAHGIGNDAAFWPWLAASIASMRSQGVRYWGMCAWDIQPGDGSWRFSDGTQAQCLSDFKANVATFVGDDLAPAAGASAAAAVPAPPGVVLGGFGGDMLTLQMSEDAFQGDAQFTVSMDGKQIGSTQAVSASHAAGQSQAFSIAGRFPPGNHTVSVAFLNDAYGGTAATDRNLYVNSVTLNGAVLPGVKLSLMGNGAQAFSFVSK